MYTVQDIIAYLCTLYRKLLYIYVHCTEYYCTIMYTVHDIMICLWNCTGYNDVCMYTVQDIMIYLCTLYRILLYIYVHCTGYNDIFM